MNLTLAAFSYRITVFGYTSSLFRTTGGHLLTSALQVIFSVFYKRVSGILRFQVFRFQEFTKKLD
jgi:hypothetical protein